jgi:hypothetical protein
MDIISDWAVKITEEAAPDEVDLAPMMAHAYINSGEDREELFRQQGGAVQGAFGPEFAMAIFPWLLQAIQFVGPELADVLERVAGAAGSGDVSGTVINATGTSYYVAGALSTILTIKGRKEREQKKQELISDERIKAVHEKLEEQVRRIPNLDGDQADLITYRVLKIMLEDPDGAKQFTQEVTKAP